MDVRIFPHPLCGTLTPPPSKSMAHRLLIAAALGGGESTGPRHRLFPGYRSDPSVHGSAGRPVAPERAGDAAPWRDRRLPGPFPRLPRFDCGESGSTLRFLIPIALAVAGGGVFTGRGRLMERPQAPYFSLFDEKGISYTQEDGVLTVRGTLRPGEYRLPGNVSSQFFTGLLFALPLLAGESTIVSTTALESSDYISMTLEALEQAGVSAAALPGAGGASVSPPFPISPLTPRWKPTGPRRGSGMPQTFWAAS